MSSRIFEARTSSGACGLCGAGFSQGERAFFLTCKGTAAAGPTSQVERSSRDTNFETGFRTVPNGTTVTGRGRFQRTRTAFKWQERTARGWVDVAVWENMVHLGCASSRGYSTPAGETTAERGKRTVGTAHSLERAPALVTSGGEVLPERETPEERAAFASLAARVEALDLPAPPAPVADRAPSYFVTESRRYGDAVPLVAPVDLTPRHAPEAKWEPVAAGAAPKSRGAFLELD